jgi:hypothetical protein
LQNQTFQITWFYLKISVGWSSLQILYWVLVQVQLTTCYELDGMHYDSGRKLMDAAYLEESLELQDIWDVIVISQVGVNKQVAAFKQHQQTSNGLPDIQPCLYKVPKGLYLMKLPLLYQELLWQSSQKNCQSCGKVPDEAALCLICGNYFCCEMEYYGKSGECSRHADEGGVSKLLAP